MEEVINTNIPLVYSLPIPTPSSDFVLLSHTLPRLWAFTCQFVFWPHVVIYFSYITIYWMHSIHISYILLYFV